MGKLLVISFDALSDNDLDRLLSFPNAKKFFGAASLVRRVKTVFLSNTYPVHTSVATGVCPEKHKVASNTKPTLTPFSDWNTDSRLIKCRTIWDAAAEKGLRVAAVLWPVTAYAKSIKYNVPEVLAKKGESQIMTSLKVGSMLTLMSAFLKHGKRFSGVSQPELDGFSTYVMRDIIRTKKPELMLLHLTCYDSFCHDYGKGSTNITQSLKSLDDNLGILLSAIGDDVSVLVFSDHGQLDVSKCVNPNFLIENMGFLEMGEKESIVQNRCFFDLCGGSAFLINSCCTNDEIEEIKSRLAEIEGYNRLLSKDELRQSGRNDANFGICALPGYCFEATYKKYRGNHGYPPDYDDYQVFYSIRGSSYKKSFETSGGSLLDVTALI